MKEEGWRIRHFIKFSATFSTWINLNYDIWGTVLPKCLSCAWTSRICKIILLNRYFLFVFYRFWHFRLRNKSNCFCTKSSLERICLRHNLLLLNLLTRQTSWVSLAFRRYTIALVILLSLIIGNDLTVNQFNINLILFPLNLLLVLLCHCNSLLFLLGSMMERADLLLIASMAIAVLPFVLIGVVQFLNGCVTFLA